MTRVLRLIVPVSLVGLFTSAAILACHHRSEPPATPRPEMTTPAGEPAPPAPPASGEGSLMTDAGMGAIAPPHAALDHRLGGPGVLLASQPVTPPGGGPTGAPPTPGAPTPSPSPAAPSPTPAPGSPTPGSPQTPGMPPSPTGPSQPGGPAPQPGSPQPPSPGTPSQTPRDAGVGDALTPPVPPMSDSGVRIDSGMSPVLQRDGGRR